MDPAILKIVAQVAGVAGIALAVFLTLFRDVIRKQIFPMLTKQQAFRLLTLILVLVWSVALAGIGAWVWINSHNTPKVEAGGAPGVPTAVGATGAPGSELVGEWLVKSTGALPEPVNQELKKNAEANAGNPKKESGNEMEKAIGDLARSVEGMAKAASQPGTFVIKLNADRKYKISDKTGIFAESSSDGSLAPSGSWTFTGADNRLVLIPNGGGVAPAFTFKTIARDRLVVDDLGGRMCVFERQQ